MDINIEFPKQDEHYGVSISLCIKNKEEALKIVADYPIVLQHLNGRKWKVRYKSIEEVDGGYIGRTALDTQQGNIYTITDKWKVNATIISIDRNIVCEEAKPHSAVRFNTDFRCKDSNASSFDDYQFVVPASLYNKNDTDNDGVDDYLGTFIQDYKDDRNPSLSITSFSKQSNKFVSLIRADVPTKDESITREQIEQRHFIHDTDIGSLGLAPSEYDTKEFILRCDYPFYERNTFCLNVDRSEWAAYKAVEKGTTIHASYIIQIGEAASLTDAAWNTTLLQMDRILNDEVKLPFSLEEAKKYRRELVHHSFREFKDKKGTPAGYFIHFSPREHYGSQNLLEYGFCGQQTMLSYDMLQAAKEVQSTEYRERALKTIDFLVNHCIAPSGLPEGMYNVDKEEFVYWMTGILYPFQYSENREELEEFLGEQVVSALMEVASELKKVEGNYCRSMVDTMHYLLLCYLQEKEEGYEHKDWLQAVVKFCDKMIAIQNENGSWNRGYSMSGEPLTNPPEWFGANELEQGSGAIFPSEVLVELYKYTGDSKYLEAARRAAEFVKRSYVEEVKYLGGLNDTTHKKSVKIDAVGVMFAMRTMLVVYEQTKEPELLAGAHQAAKILGTWTYLWDIPIDESTLLGKHGFKSTGWAGCDVIPAGSYVDCEFAEFVPDLLRIAEYCKDERLAVLAKIVTRGMHHGLSMPQNMYGYAMPGIQCEGYMTSLWLSDTTHKNFSGAVAKNKGDDNDTTNGLVNGQALYNLDSLKQRYGTFDFDSIIKQVLA
ncbi:hypothetical protein E1I69_13245 [Bacillus timonensis]|uniref:Uncharacterized protein n=1 Tax=Bacillus timonensis TaxID=1033734 RepID=A0A4S3PQC2_9BACI|nr:hypothetical protein [Bacillus timonensis]THE11847.1 hypothetical protein E1I69_13245 [Bacillus timonensis]